MSQGGWGFVDACGAWAIDPAWEKVGRFSDGRAWALREGKLGYVDPDGEIAIPCDFRQAWPFSGSVAQVSKDGLSTYVIGRDGAPLYDKRRETRRGLTVVSRFDAETRRDRWGVIDDTGQVRVVVEHEEVVHVGPLLVCRGSTRDRVLDLDGAPLLELPRHPFEALHRARRTPAGWLLSYFGEVTGTQRFLDESGKLVHTAPGDAVQILEAPLRYLITSRNDVSVPEAGIFKGTPTRVCLDERYQVIDEPADDRRGLRVVKERRVHHVVVDGARVAGPFAEAHVRVELDEGGALGRTCVWVMAQLGNKKLWGTLDERGRTVLPTEHEVRRFEGATTVLGSLGRVGLVGPDGGWLLGPSYTDARDVGAGRYAVYVGGKALKNGTLKGGAWALVDPRGERITEPIFAAVGDRFGDGLLAATPL